MKKKELMHPTLRRQTTNEQAQKKERKGMREREKKDVVFVLQTTTLSQL